MAVRLELNDEFELICREILDEHKTPRQWAEIESDDMFQSRSFVGGYDADEEAFCFSYYAANGQEYWFQVDLNEVELILRGEKINLEIRPAG